MGWHNHKWTTSKQLTTSWISLSQASNSTSKGKQIIQNILRSLCLFLRRKVKSIETLVNYQKRVHQLYFYSWSPRHSSPIHTSGFEGWKQEFRNQIFSQVKNITTYKAFRKQSNFQALSLYLLDLFSRICLVKSQTKCWVFIWSKPNLIIQSVL